MSHPLHSPLDTIRFLQLILGKMAERPTEPAISKAFRHFDTESKGGINAEDLRRMADLVGETVTDEEIHEMISEADTTDTGEVNQADFLKIITTYAQHYDGNS